MAQPLMPKATAVWLVENTALTFDQIAEFCNLHPLEVQAIADGEVGTGIQGLDPIANGELTQEEIDRCSNDPNGRLVQAKTRNPQPRAKPRGARYTPVSKRQDRPDAIAWLLKNYPELGDAQISRLIGTTKPTINAVRDKTHWNAPNIKPQNPVSLGLCTAIDLEKSVLRARRKAEREGRPIPRPEAEPAPQEETSLDPRAAIPGLTAPADSGNDVTSPDAETEF
ncbi:MAG: DUF1013 domain-containing protein [Rhodospirillales bacterium]|nr:DUF1013 domain-containing protein [Rhodospirillales bacterium]